MIKDNKKINPILGIIIAFIIIFFGIFGILLLFGEILSEGLYILIVIPFALVGTFFLFINVTYLGLKRLAKTIDESAAAMNPETFIGNTYSITKIRNLFVLKYNDNYLHIVRMKERNDYFPSWLRKTFLGPRIPTNVPLKCPVVTELHGFPIRKCESHAGIYDSEENRWISGQATMFSIFFFSQPMSQLLYPEVFLNLIESIERFE